MAARWVGDVVGVAPANIRWSQPGKPDEIVGEVRGRLAVPAAGLFRLLPLKFASFFKIKEVSFS